MPGAQHGPIYENLNQSYMSDGDAPGRPPLPAAYRDKFVQVGICGSPPGVMMADTLSFNAKIGLVDF